jgi:hypothetical protein
MTFIPNNAKRRQSPTEAHSLSYMGTKTQGFPVMPNRNRKGMNSQKTTTSAQSTFALGKLQS